VCSENAGSKQARTAVDQREAVQPLAEGVENGVDKEPAVRIVVMGGGSGRRNTAGRLDHRGKMARRIRLAATVDPMDRLLPAWRPDARPGEAGRGAAAAGLPLRSARSRADDRWAR
jgi:hypothetical protein